MDSFDYHDPMLAGIEYESQRNQQRLAAGLASTVSWPPPNADSPDSTAMPSDHDQFEANAAAAALAMNMNMHTAAEASRTTMAPVPIPNSMAAFAHHQHQQQRQHQQHQHPSPQNHPALQSTAAYLANEWAQLQQFAQQQHHALLHDPNLQAPDTTAAAFTGPLTGAPVDLLPVSTTTMDPSLAVSAETHTNFMPIPTTVEEMQALNAFRMNELNDMMTYPMMNNNALAAHLEAYAQSAVTGHSPSESSWLEVRSLSDHGWNMVDLTGPPSRQSFDSYDAPGSAVFNPSQTLHIRTSSDSTESDVALSAHSGSSFEEVLLGSPGSENHDFFFSQPSPHLMQTKNEHSVSAHSSVSPPAAPPAALVRAIPSSSTSPTSSGPSSPPARRRRSPSDRSSDAIIKKVQSPAIKKEPTEKKVGKRKGPLRPDQRQQAHEIRKLRACLRCKFLKKTCDKGDPCAGCKPSHTRLWQVPCTRIDIKDIGFFMKDWKADYERHVTLGFSVQNIKGFSPVERTLFVTHGYGHYIQIQAREIFVRDEGCFGVDWVETNREVPLAFEAPTARLSAGVEGISSTLLSEYLDNHIDAGFDKWVDDYFQGTKFVCEILKTAYNFYLRERLPVIRKALKLVLAYNLTLNVTFVEGMGEDEEFPGKIDDTSSVHHGKTLAPVMINFQIKGAMADMWRELQKDILEELSALYSSVYSKDKLKNWPTIFMLAALLLVTWELMQFDCHYRVPDQSAVDKFCTDMETTPVGVIVGLFTAISQKLPAFNEWDTRKHHHLLNSNPAVCDAMTEVRQHVNKYEGYLRSRSKAEYDRDDYDSLSNKFLSKLVIRAN